MDTSKRLKFRAWVVGYQLGDISAKDMAVHIPQAIQNFRVVLIFKHGGNGYPAFRLYLKGWTLSKLTEGTGGAWELSYWLTEKPPQIIPLNVQPQDIDVVKVIEVATMQLAEAFNVPVELLKPKKIKHRWKFIGKQTINATTVEYYQCTRCPMHRRSHRTFDNTRYTKYFDQNGNYIGSIAGECPNTTNPTKTIKPE